jgi:hypothetical protein
MPGGRPFELIEASRLARQLKEASPLEGLTGGPAVGPQMVLLTMTAVVEKCRANPSGSH